jgi:flagellar M-ring protein FliF
MNDFLGRLLQQTKEFFQNLDKGKKTRLILGSLFVVLSASILIFFLTRVEYVPLINGATYEQSAGITSKLDELNITWKTENDSSAVLVPKVDLSKAKMALAVDGLLTEEDFTWTDVFASNGLFVTSSDKEQMYMQAKASGLSLAIKTLDGIDDAIVNLHISNDTPFLIDTQSGSKASIIVNLKSGYELSKDQVNGIVMIVANSVKGLEQENITLTDQTGKRLNDDSYAASSNGTDQFELKSQIEDRLSVKIQEFLASVFGVQNVKVITGVILDFDDETTSSVVFSPPIEGEANGLIRSMSEVKENVLNAAAEGVPGTETNTGITNTATPTGSESNYEKASSTLNYELNQINTEIVKAKGQIEDISVAVMINKKSLVNSELTEESKKEIESLVSVAAGLNTKLVNVTAMDFAEIETQEFSSSTPPTSVPIWVFALIVGLVVAGGVIGFILYKKKNQNERTKEKEDFEKLKQEEIESIKTDYEDKNTPKYQIEQFINAKPEIVSLLLRNWINEE